MAEAQFDSADIVVIDSAESTTGWTQTGQMGPVLDEDFFLQGSSAVGIEFKNVNPSEFRFNRGTGSTIVGKHLRLWTLVGTGNAINVFASQGVTVRVWDSGGSNWGEWDLAGSDQGDWTGKGFKMIVQDCDKAFDRDSGTAPSKTDIQYIGFGIDVTAQLSKANGFIIDRIMISNTADTTDVTGGVLQVTSPEHTGSADLDFNDNGGSPDTIVRAAGDWAVDGFELGDTIVVTGTTSNNIEMVITAVSALTLDVATGTVVDEQNTSGLVVAVVSLNDIVRKDQAIDDSFFGHVFKDVNGSIELTGKIVFGDASGALNTIIRDTNKVMIWADNAVSTSQYKISVVEDSGNTEVSFGSEVGTGDDSKGVGGGTMTRNEDTFTFEYSLVANDSGVVFNWFGGVIDGCNGGLDLSVTGVQFVSCTVSNSGQIVLSNGAEMREGFITDSIEPSGVGAILINVNPVDPEFRDMGLINNFHAIEWETAGDNDLDLRNISFAGNVADVRFNHDSGLLTLNVLEFGDTPTTSDGGAGGTVAIVNAKDLDVHCERKDDNSDIENVRVLIRRVSDGSTISTGLTDVNGDFNDTFDFVSDVSVEIEVRKSTLPIPRYFTEFQSGTITTNGLITNFLMREDEIVSQA